MNLQRVVVLWPAPFSKSKQIISSHDNVFMQTTAFYKHGVPVRKLHQPKIKGPPSLVRNFRAVCECTNELKSERCTLTHKLLFIYIKKRDKFHQIVSHLFWISSEFNSIFDILPTLSWSSGFTVINAAVNNAVKITVHSYNSAKSL